MIYPERARYRTHLSCIFNMKEIVKEYAGGLFELAVGEELEETLLSETRKLGKLFTPEYLRLLTVPDIPKAERVALVSEALDGRVHRYTADFVKLLVSRGYAGYICECFSEFERLYMERHGIIKAVAESAVPLDEKQKARLRERLEAHTGRQVELECRINKSLLCGIRLSFDNRLIDDSAESRLREISAALTGVTL